MNLTEKTKRNLITAFVNGTIRPKDIPFVEELLGENEVYRYYYERKVQERDFVLQLIPDQKLSLENKRILSHEISLAVKDIFGETKISWKEKLTDFLNKPVITIKY